MVLDSTKYRRFQFLTIPPCLVSHPAFSGANAADSSDVDEDAGLVSSEAVVDTDEAWASSLAFCESMASSRDMAVEIREAQVAHGSSGLLPDSCAISNLNMAAVPVSRTLVLVLVALACVCLGNGGETVQAHEGIEHSWLRRQVDLRSSVEESILQVEATNSGAAIQGLCSPPPSLMRAPSC